MKTQAFNPFLPSFEYIPDAEPYVFGDRVYIYGSHDRFNGEDFCLNDYVCWSASVDDLGGWRKEGVIYRAAQDPLNGDGSQNLFAPDVQVGFDFIPEAHKQMGLGAVHSVEVPFALDTLDRGYFSYCLKGTPKEHLEAVRDQISNAWIQFAKTGTPASNTLEWPEYTGPHSPVHLFNLNPSNEDVRLDERIFRVWEKIGVPYEKEDTCSII